jgi:recombination protein RecA
MSADNKEKLKALQLTIDKLEKTYGKGTIMKLDGGTVEGVEAISTGSLGLDIALGIGGFPTGRIIEIYGPESSGKTTLAQHAIAQVQKKGGMAAFIDAEHAFDKTYAQKLGIDVDNLLISQPDDGEQALEIADALIRSGAIDIIVIDSVAALVPKAEIEGDMGDSKMGLQARLMSQALRKLTGTINKTGCICIFINQLREKIGVMFGNPETTTGGNALKFYASVRLDIRRIGQIKEGNDIIGNRTKVKVVKNKVAPPFRTVEFDIIYGEGISKVGEIVDLGSEMEIVKKSGSWFSYGDTKLGQGREAVKQLFLDNPELADEIEAKVKEKGFTIVPLRIFFNEKHLAKLEIGVGRGKKEFDKRETIKNRDIDKDIKRYLAK